MIGLLRILAAPFGLIYGLIVAFRNKLYDWGIFNSRQHSIPTICVGNLNTGGTGKSPHIEYLIRLLKGKYKLATLSRGYKRKTIGFVLANKNPSIAEIGDEPKQFKLKFPEIEVAVDVDRNEGVDKLLEADSGIELILLDDAFQHRAIKPSINILLSDYSNLYSRDTILPIGNLREFRKGAERSDFIIVTKCLEILSPIDVRRIEDELELKAHQQLFFSYINYGKPKSISDGKEIELGNNLSILLFSGIANPNSLKYYLTEKVREVEDIRFADHHEFDINDLEQIKNKFKNILNPNKIILTTEKDFCRLEKNDLKEVLAGLPVYYIDIEVHFHSTGSESFDEAIQKKIDTIG